MARLAMTSLAFMFVWVPLPVCQTTSGKCSSSRPSITSSAAWTMASALSAGQQAELAVDEGGRLLDQPERPDHLAGEALAPDLEVVEGSLGLRSPVAIRGHLDGAHAVGFLPRLHLPSPPRR